MFIGGGTLAYYSPTGSSELITPQPDPSIALPTTKLYAPNGIARGKDGLFYMADSYSGKVSVYTLSPPTSPGSNTPILRQIDSIDLEYTLDNISVDSEGTLWVAGFPKPLHIMKANKSPPGTVPIAAVVLSVKKVGEGEGNGGWKSGYVVETVLEDGIGKVLSGVTVAVHDAVSERVFVGGLTAGYLGVCEKRR